MAKQEDLNFNLKTFNIITPCPLSQQVTMQAES